MKRNLVNDTVPSYNWRLYNSHRLGVPERRERWVAMSELRKEQQFAIGAVSRHFSATWQSGDGPPDAYMTVGGRRIALDVAVIAQQRPVRKRVAKARLREDVVTRRVLCHIESALRAHVPDGKTIILTLGAPIRVPNKLLAALTDTLLTYLGSGAEETEEKKSILGNRVRFRVLNDNSKWKAKVIGFVFSGDPEPGILASAMRSLHDEIAAKAKTRMPERFVGDRWLVLGNDHWIADIKTYRRAYSQLSPPHNFRRILMLLDGGRVEDLGGDLSAGQLGTHWSP